MENNTFISRKEAMIIPWIKVKRQWENTDRRIKIKVNADPLATELGIK
jgi:hypothetical protein